MVWNVVSCHHIQSDLQQIHIPSALLQKRRSTVNKNLHEPSKAAQKKVSAVVECSIEPIKCKQKVWCNFARIVSFH